MSKIGHVVVILLLAACNQSGPFAKSPGETTVKAFMAANSRDYTGFRQLCSKHLVEYFAKTVGGGDSDRGLQFLCSELARPGMIDRIEITQEKFGAQKSLLTGADASDTNGAEVWIAIHYKDGTSDTAHQSLVREDGIWKLMI